MIPALCIFGSTTSEGLRNKSWGWTPAVLGWGEQYETPLITLLKLNFPQQWEMRANGSFGNASCWLSSLCPSRGHGKTVTSGLELQKYQINMFPPKAPSSSISNWAKAVTFCCFITERGWVWHLSLACGSGLMEWGQWKERGYFSGNPPGTVLCKRFACHSAHPLFSITSLVPSHFKVQNCLRTRDKLEPKC